MRTLTRRLLPLLALLVTVFIPSQRLYAASRSTPSVPSFPRPIVLATIPLPPGTAPFDIAMDAGHNRAYVANSSGNSVSVLDTSTNQLVTTIPNVGTGPTGIAVNAHTGRAYVAVGNAVAVIDLATNTLLAPINLGSASTREIAVQSRSNRAYVTTSANSVIVLDLARGRVLTTISDLSFLDPYGVAVDPSRPRAYVVNQYGDSVSVIDTDTITVMKHVTVGANPYGVAVDPVTRQVYVTDSTIRMVSVIDTTADADTVVATIPVGSGPYGIAVNPVRHRAYITNIYDKTVSVLDTRHNTILAAVPVGSGPHGIAVNLRTNDEYTANFDASTVSVIGMSQ